jgi:hypothetical protein
MELFVGCMSIRCLSYELFTIIYYQVTCNAVEATLDEEVGVPPTGGNTMKAPPRNLRRKKRKGGARGGRGRIPPLGFAIGDLRTMLLS